MSNLPSESRFDSEALLFLLLRETMPFTVTVSSPEFFGASIVNEVPSAFVTVIGVEPTFTVGEVPKFQPETFNVSPTATGYSP